MLRLASTSNIIVFVLALLLPLISASATKQFNLDPRRDTSECWAECHHFVVNTVPLPGYKTNVQAAIGPNCKNDKYILAMSTCLASQCSSAPDAAYGAEYATSICKRAGIDMEMTLPETYLESAAEYFQSEAYLSRGTRGVGNWGLGGVILLAVPALLAALV